MGKSKDKLEPTRASWNPRNKIEPTPGFHCLQTWWGLWPVEEPHTPLVRDAQKLEEEPRRSWRSHRPGCSSTANKVGQCRRDNTDKLPQQPGPQVTLMSTGLPLPFCLPNQARTLPVASPKSRTSPCLTRLLLNTNTSPYVLFLKNTWKANICCHRPANLTFDLHPPPPKISF